MDSNMGNPSVGGDFKIADANLNKYSELEEKLKETDEFKDIDLDELKSYIAAEVKKAMKDFEPKLRELQKKILSEFKKSIEEDCDNLQRALKPVVADLVRRKLEERNAYNALPWYTKLANWAWGTSKTDSEPKRKSE